MVRRRVIYSLMHYPITWFSSSFYSKIKPCPMLAWKILSYSMYSTSFFSPSANFWISE